MTTELEALRAVAKKAKLLYNRLPEELDERATKARDALNKSLEDLEAVLQSAVVKNTQTTYVTRCTTVTDGDVLECGYSQGHDGRHTWQCKVMTPWGIGSLDYCLKRSGHSGLHSTERIDLGKNV